MMNQPIVTGDKLHDEGALFHMMEGVLCHTMGVDELNNTEVVCAFGEMKI